MEPITSMATHQIWSVTLQRLKWFTNNLRVKRICTLNYRNRSKFENTRSPSNDTPAHTQGCKWMHAIPRWWQEKRRMEFVGNGKTWGIAHNLDQLSEKVHWRMASFMLSRSNAVCTNTWHFACKAPHQHVPQKIMQFLVCVKRNTKKIVHLSACACTHDEAAGQYLQHVHSKLGIPFSLGVLTRPTTLSSS